MVCERDCTHTACMLADMDKTIRDNGGDPARYGVTMVEERRTRYAPGGQHNGMGRVVRHVSAGQLRLITRLMEERDTRNMRFLPGSEDVTRMSLTGARDFIDRLLACPYKPGYPKERMASDKQMEWLTKTGACRVVPDACAPVIAAALREPPAPVTFDDAKRVLDVMFKQPYKERVTVTGAPVAEVTQTGLYETPNGTIYVVQKARDSGHLYAKRVDRVGSKVAMVYESGAIRKLTAGMRITIERAEELSLEWGVCLICGRTLTVKESVTRGIGPICHAKYGG